MYLLDCFTNRAELGNLLSNKDHNEVSSQQDGNEIFNEYENLNKEKVRCDH